jgi:leader peptidase (prepilin peptidase)/N-methyltransferase
VIEDFLWIPAVLLGFAVGSFGNVVAYRVPLKLSVVSPGSACPRCEHLLAWRDNIPLVSWLVLRGRCRYCGDGISARYPIVEAATAALFGAATLVIGAVWVLPAYLWFIGATVALTLTDLDHKLIPNRILFPSSVVGAVLLGVGALIDGRLPGFGRALLGAAAYFAILLVVALVAKGGFGFGDVKLAWFLGLFTAYLGWSELLVAVFLPFAVGGVVSILLLITRIKGRKDAIPFGPYMVIGAYLAMTFGERIADWYLG